MDWTSESIDRLRALWAEGHSTAEIGRRMGISKNAVVGKAHRLQLPARPSPIRREAASPRPVAAGRRATLPPLRVSLAAEPAAPAPRREEPRTLAQPPQPRAVLPASPVLRPFPRGGVKTCCWPIGEPGTEGFRFCTAEAMSPKPYCAEHAALAYVRVKDRREDAA